MNQTPLPLTRELVLIGGGHTHALVLRRWGMTPLSGARLTLINPGPTAPYTGMLPGHVAGHYSREDLEIDLVRLARFAGARLILGAVEGIDAQAKHIHVPGRPPIAYDLASINIGITSDPPGLPGFAEHAIAAKPLGPYARAWSAFRSAVADNSKPPQVTMIGAGVGGVELGLAMAHALQGLAAAPQITVIERDMALPGLQRRARMAMIDQMSHLGINLIENADCAEVTATDVRLADGRTVPSAFTVGVTGARPHLWPATTDLSQTDGFLDVDDTLRTSDPAIYAAGDCAHLPQARPKAGVFAVREAPVLYHNLRADLTGGTRKQYRPQRDFLKLISLGGKSALADKWRLGLQGLWLWRWKDRIDRKFMSKFHDLPQMSKPALPRPATLGMAEAVGDKPMCGGCGAKVGGGTLLSVLQSLPPNTRTDILGQPGDDAATLRVGNATQVITTDHLRAFTEDPWVMARIAAIHAMGDIWAMGARPQAALAQIILPRLSDPMQRAWMAEIMAAAQSTFAEAGANIAGGHTSVGAELTIGFTVTGLLDGPAITLAGAQPGDALILTKPIGSGTILAGEMATQARGEWVAEALALMMASQDAAALTLTHARAMTDVTGFGLAGHLMAMCRASDVSAEINLNDIPLMPGAESLCAKGVRSTLHPANREIAAQMTVPDDIRAELLFDPQTAGGLLAAIPTENTEKTLVALQATGTKATLIGHITAGTPHIAVLAG